MKEMSKNRLRLFNTMLRRKEVFTPRNGQPVKLFTCGPSIYDRPHIGNYRTFLYEDLLHRYLLYQGMEVQRMINFTDIEDKSIVQSGRSMKKLRDITETASDNFFKNCGLLHIKIPDYIPRSSTSIDQVVQLIEQLLDKGLAYWHGKDIFYDPLKFKGFGRLYGLDMSKWPRKKRRYRKDTYSGNRWNLGDFILWHGHRPKRDGDIFWETPLGRGRPAWNVQDPAMITKHLGFEIDIACGGVDNLYRHHDYNIAVIEGVSGSNFANFWLHGEHVMLDGQKMSKSDGNIIYPHDLLDKNFRAADIRLSLTADHYRDKINLTEDLLQKRQEQCQKLQKLARRFSVPVHQVKAIDHKVDAHITALESDFNKAMNDDLDVGKAYVSLFSHLKKIAGYRQRKALEEGQRKRLYKLLLHIDSVVQIMFV